MKETNIPHYGTTRVTRRFLWWPKTIIRVEVLTEEGSIYTKEISEWREMARDEIGIIRKKEVQTRFLSVERWEEKFVKGKYENFWKPIKWLD